MEVVVSAFAVLVALGCLIFLVRTSRKSKNKEDQGGN